MQWFSLFKNEWRFILFGLIFTMSSSLGQTFFISLFIPSITLAYQISTTEFANYYALITLASAFGLPLIGRLIDSKDLLFYAGFVTLALFLATLLIFMDLGAFTLILSIFVIRLCGQGLMSHIALTSLARHFVHKRGRILALVTMGHPLAESFLPIITLMLITSIGWQITYLFFGAFILVVLFPVAYLLVHQQASFRKISALPESSTSDDTGGANTFRKSALPLLIILPSFVCVPMMATALIFHQSTLSAHFSIELEVFAKAFVFFALFQILCTFISGSLIDRIGAKKTYPIHLITLSLTFLFLTKLEADFDVFIYMAMLGSSAGLGSTTKTAVIAELVAPQNLGKIKSYATSAMVFSTALGPAMLSNTLDMGISFNTFNFAASGFCLLSLFLALWSFWLLKK